MTASCRAVHPEFPEYVCLKAEHGKDHAHSNGQGISWTEQSAYVPDQAAVDWARGCVERSLVKLRRWETEAQQKGNPDSARQWKKIAWMMEYELIGGGCIIGPFHPRVTSLQADIDALFAGD